MISFGILLQQNIFKVLQTEECSMQLILLWSFKKPSKDVSYTKRNTIITTGSKCLSWLICAFIPPKFTSFMSQTETLWLQIRYFVFLSEIVNGVLNFTNNLLEVHCFQTKVSDLFDISKIRVAIMRSKVLIFSLTTEKVIKKVHMVDCTL